MAYFTTTDNVNICYNIQGNGEKALLFLHGWGGNQLSFNPVIKMLKDKYRIITYDHRGFGQSDKPGHGYTIEHLAKDVKELIEHLDLKDLTLVGWSMGGVTSLTYLSIYGSARVSSAVIIDVNPKVLVDDTYAHGLLNGTYTKTDAFDDLAKMSTGLINFVKEMPEKANMRLYNQEMREIFINAVVEQNELLPCMCFWLSICEADLRYVIPKVDVPVLFCHGGTSAYCPPEARDYALSLFQEVELASFSDCSHFIPIERPAEFAEAVDNFVINGIMD